MRPFGDEQPLLGIFESALDFGLGVLVNGVDDPVAPSIVDMLCCWRGQSCWLLAEGATSNDNAGFRYRDKGDNLQQVRPGVEVASGGSIHVSFHWCLKGEGFQWCSFILVTFDIDVG